MANNTSAAARFPLCLLTSRTAAGMNQQQAADRLQVSRSTITKWETAEVTPPLPTMIGALWLLGQPAAELAAFADAEPPTPAES